jgi:hypothetical protein
MGLNIKNPRVEGNIRKLAERMGVGLTEAIDHVVVEGLRKLDREERRTKVVPPLLEQLQPLLDELAAQRIDWRDSKEIMDELYDEHGLPK